MPQTFLSKILQIQKPILQHIFLKKDFFMSHAFSVKTANILQTENLYELKILQKVYMIYIILVLIDV